MSSSGRPDERIDKRKFSSGYHRSYSRWQDRNQYSSNSSSANPNLIPSSSNANNNSNSSNSNGPSNDYYDRGYYNHYGNGRFGGYSKNYYNNHQYSGSYYKNDYKNDYNDYGNDYKSEYKSDYKGDHKNDYKNEYKGDYRRKNDRYKDSLKDIRYSNPNTSSNGNNSNSLSSGSSPNEGSWSRKNSYKMPNSAPSLYSSSKFYDERNTSSLSNDLIRKEKLNRTVIEQSDEKEIAKAKYDNDLKLKETKEPIELELELKDIDNEDEKNTDDDYSPPIDLSGFKEENREDIEGQQQRLEGEENSPKNGVSKELEIAEESTSTSSVKMDIDQPIFDTELLHEDKSKLEVSIDHHKAVEKEEEEEREEPVEVDSPKHKEHSASSSKLVSEIVEVSNKERKVETTETEAPKVEVTKLDIEIGNEKSAMPKPKPKQNPETEAKTKQETEQETKQETEQETESETKLRQDFEMEQEEANEKGQSKIVSLKIPSRMSTPKLPEFDDIIPNDLTDHGCIYPLNQKETKLFELKKKYKVIKEYKSHPLWLRYLFIEPVKSLIIYPFYNQNFLIHKQYHSDRLIKRLSSAKRKLFMKRLKLIHIQNYKSEKWSISCEKMDEQLEVVHPGDDELHRELESVFPTKLLNESTNSRNTSRRARYGGGDSVKTEEEFMEVLKSLNQQQQEQDPVYKAEQVAATIPNLILDPIKKRAINFMDSNNIVHDKTEWSKRIVTNNVNTFSEKEHQLFVEAFLSYPKRFGKISQVMGGLRTAEECVLHYYQTKKTLTNYKQLIQNKNKRSGRRSTNKSKRAKSKSLNEEEEKSTKSPIENIPPPDLNEELFTETGRRKRAAAPVFDSDKKREDESPTDVQPPQKKKSRKKTDEKERDKNKLESAPRNGTPMSEEEDIEAKVVEKPESTKIIADITQESSQKQGVKVDGRNGVVHNTTIKFVDIANGVFQESANTISKGQVNSDNVKDSNKIGGLLEGGVVQAEREPKAHKVDKNKFEKDLKLEISAKSPIANIVQDSSNVHNNQEFKINGIQNVEVPNMTYQAQNTNTSSNTIASNSEDANDENSKSKKKHISSYWSVTDINTFPNLLTKYGTNWSTIAENLNTKTSIMVRNYFLRNGAKEGWVEIAKMADLRNGNYQEQSGTASNSQLPQVNLNQIITPPTSQQPIQSHPYPNPKSGYLYPSAVQTHPQMSWFKEDPLTVPMGTFYNNNSISHNTMKGSGQIITPKTQIGSSIISAPKSGSQTYKTSINAMLNSDPLPATANLSLVGPSYSTPTSVSKTSAIPPVSRAPVVSRTSIMSLLNNDSSPTKTTTTSPAPPIHHPPTNNYRSNIDSLLNAADSVQQQVQYQPHVNTNEGLNALVKAAALPNEERNEYQATKSAITTRYPNILNNSTGSDFDKTR